MIPNELFQSGLHRHQRELLDAFDDRRREGVVLGQQFFAEWHRRARKTTLALNLCIREAYRFPRGKYVYVAPTQVQARNIIWNDPNMLTAYLPDKREMNWRLNSTEMLVTFENGSILKIGGADEPDSWRGTDFVGIVLDEWSLMKAWLWGEIVEPVLSSDMLPHIQKHQPFRWVFFIYTPKPEGSHASRMFDRACGLTSGGVLPDNGRAPKMAPNTYASRLDAERSGILSARRLLAARQNVLDGLVPQATYDQEYRCRRITREEMTLITTENIQELNEHRQGVVVVSDEDRKIVSIDPAWGGDVCQIMGLVNDRVMEGASTSIVDKLRTSEIVLAAKQSARHIGTKNFIVDTVNSPGIADALQEDEAGYIVQRFKSSFRAPEKDGVEEEIVCANLRARAYLYASQQIRRKRVGVIDDEELKRQLPLASKYTTQTGTGRMIVIPKKQIRKELGCSPDKADCYIMGVWGGQYVMSERQNRREFSDRYNDRPVSAMC